METYGWQRLLKHEGRLEADLTLSDAAWMRPLQSGYRPNWRVEGTHPPDPMEGPLLLRGARTALPGSTVAITIFPLVPQVWQHVEVGDLLELLERRRERVMGTAVVRSIVDLKRVTEGADRQPEQVRRRRRWPWP